jgi:hypothetical protein
VVSAVVVVVVVGSWCVWWCSGVGWGGGILQHCFSAVP